VISVEDKIPSFKVIIRPWFKLTDSPTQPGFTPKQLDLCRFTFAYICVSFLFVLCFFYFLCNLSCTKPWLYIYIYIYIYI
jgi:hypothetical protein